MTMTNDPDLDAAIEDLRYDARRFRDLQRQLPRLDEVKDYRKLSAAINELADMEERFSVRGERLKLDDDRRRAGRALLMLCEEVERLRTRSGRRPSSVQLHGAMQIAEASNARRAAELDAEVVAITHARRLAANDAAASSSAVRYLEASR